MVRVAVLSDFAYIGQDAEAPSISSVQEQAVAEALRSIKAANAEIEYLGSARPADWEFRINQSIRRIPSEFKTLEGMVRGKTGNPDLEKQAFSLWGDVHKTAIHMLENKPSVARQVADRGALFLTDFWSGVKDAQAATARWAITAAGPVLKKYHEAVRRFLILEKDLKIAEANPGKYNPTALAAHRAKVLRSGSILAKIDGVFKTLSGGLSLTKVAEEEYGPLGALVAVAVALSVAAIAGWVTVGAAYIQSVKPLTDEAQATIAKGKETIEMAKKAIPIVIGLGAAAVIFYIFSVIKKS